MRNIKVKHLKQTGDTIVEVLLAIVVISGTLAMTFAIANKSTKGTQANYERYTAQTIANNQAELLKQKMKSGVQHDSFGTGVATTSVANVTGALNCFNGSDKKTGNDCKGQGTNGLYTVQIECLKDDSESNCSSTDTYRNYRIHVEWDSLNGAKDNVELFYGV